MAHSVCTCTTCVRICHTCVQPASSCTSLTFHVAAHVPLPSETLLRWSTLDHTSPVSAPAVDAAAAYGGTSISVNIILELNQFAVCVCVFGQ